VERLKKPYTYPFRSPVFSSYPGITALVALAILLYTAVFSAVSILGYRNFGMSAFDIGIHVQAIWKLSSGRGLFNTVRGLPIWGDHCWFVMLLYTPLYWLLPRVETLLILQSFALAMGAMPLAVILLRRGAGSLAAVIFSLAWLLSPALQNMNLENFHPEVLAAPFLLWSVERAEAEKWKGYWFAVGVALLCKEDVALTTFMIGVWVSFRNKKTGILTMIISLAWFFLCMKVFLPFFNDEGFFRFEGGYWFSTFWHNKFEPSYYWETFAQARVGRYAWQLGLPLLFLFLGTPLLAAAALPGFMVNVLSSNDYLISIDYHYNFQALPMLFAASAMSFSWLRREKGLLTLVSRIVLLGILAASLWANLQWSFLPLDKIKERLSKQYSFFRDSGVELRFRKFATLLPADPEVPIAVSHNLLPHLAHRNEIFMYPNPFTPQYWGINGENLPSADIIEMLLLDTNAIGPGNMAIFKRLVETGTFVIEKQEGPMVLAKKAAPSADKIPVLDPMTLQPPVDNIRLLVFLSDGEVHSLTPLWGRRADFELLTSEMRIPLTAGRLNTVEGLDLGTHDNLRLFFSGAWDAEGKQDVIFRLQADDGCRLFIDGRIIIDHEGVHGFGQKVENTPMQLSPGRHVIALDYFEWGGEAGVQVEWAPAGGEFQVLQSGQTLP
jgi:uncharacterized membrane protein